MGLELGRGGARWIDRSVDGSMHPRGRECNRRSGRNSRSSRAIERRDDDDGRRARARSTTHRTPAAASPGLSRPRGASARRTSRRGRAPGGRARARGARMRRRRGETSLVSRGAVAARSVRTRRDDKAGRTERIGRSRGASRHSARARRARRTPSSRAKKFSFAAETRARRRLARLRGRRRSSRPRSSIVDRSSSRPIGAVAAEKARRRKKKSNPISVGMASSPLARASPRWSSPSRDTSSFSSRTSSGSATTAASKTLRASHLACRAKRGGASTSTSSGFGYPPAAPPNFLGELERLRGAGVDVHDFGVEYMCEGETSERVAELQRYLAGEGHYKYRDGATGYFGPITVRQTASRTTAFAWCTPFLEDFSRRHSSPALPFQRLTGKTFD